MSGVALKRSLIPFCGGAKESENKKRLNDFLSKPTVSILPVSKETAKIFGIVKQQLKSADTPIPLNDVWIAAHALENGGRLISYDKHFKQVAGVLLWQN